MQLAHPNSVTGVLVDGCLRAALTVALAVTMIGCADSEGRFVEQRLYSMGTWVDLAIEASGATEAAATLDEIETMLRRFEVDYYAWADGELKRLNDAIHDGRSVEVSPELGALLREAQRLSTLSEGAFDPAVGDLVELWGFQSAPAPDAQPPHATAVEAWRDSADGIGGLTIDGLRVRPGEARMKLDLGGIAKGEAVDRIIGLLTRRGIRNALVNAGGDLRVMGKRGERPWRVGVQSPRGEGLLGIIELADGEAAFTSGDYERFYEGDGKRMHHILDPRTGYPATDTQAVTVVTRQGVGADAAATALFVAGRDRWRRIAKAMGVEMVLRVDSSGSIEVTKKMRERLSGEALERADVILVEF